MEEGSVYAMLMRGRELLEDGHPEQAATLLESARRAEPRKGSILEVLGRAYFALGRYHESARSFERALDVDPNNDYAHHCLGRCYLKLGRRTEAAGHFKIAWYLCPREEYRQQAARFGTNGAYETGSAGAG